MRRCACLTYLSGAEMRSTGEAISIDSGSAQ
jgi:hypothetical protein